MPLIILPWSEYKKEMPREAAYGHPGTFLHNNKSYRTTLIVHPWRLELQPTEPESVILSIKLWVHHLYSVTKLGICR